MENILFQLNNLSVNYLTLLKFIWDLTSSRIQVEFGKKGYDNFATGKMALDRPKNCKCFGFCSITYVSMNGLLLNIYGT